MFRIYVKRHNKTSLKYLGATGGNVDPNKALGGGRAWRRHPEEHGNDFTTVVFARDKRRCSPRQSYGPFH